MQALPLICALGLYLGTCELVEYHLVRRQAAEIFPPKLGWRLLRCTGIAGCSAGAVERLHWSAERPNDWPLWLYVLHGVVNQKQDLFLDALRRYLPPEALDPGLYDWHP